MLYLKLYYPKNTIFLAQTERRACNSVQKKKFGIKNKKTEFGNKTYTNVLKSGLVDLATKKDYFCEDILMKPPGYYCKTNQKK